MKALIDADWFAYAHGGATDDEGKPLKWYWVAGRINQQIENIVYKSGADSYALFLSGGGNFRESTATIRPYKGNRPSDKPFHYERIRDYLIKFRNAILIEGMEADDAVSIEQMKLYNQACEEGDWSETYSEGTVICSIDKDLDNTPGWHYNWIKDEKYWIDEITALRSFYSQLLTGDPVDNIPGLFGVGQKSSLVKKLGELKTEESMYNHVKEQYEKRFGSYWQHFLLENAQLLWILREDPRKGWSIDDSNECILGHEIEITERLERLENVRYTRGL